MAKSIKLKAVETVQINHVMHDQDHVTQDQNLEIDLILHLDMIPVHDPEIQDPKIVTINHAISMNSHHDQDMMK